MKSEQDFRRAEILTMDSGNVTLTNGGKGIPVKPRQVSKTVKEPEIKTLIQKDNVMKKPPDVPLMSDDVDLNKLFSSEIGNENDVLKDLFTYENIKTKTDVSRNDISIISRLEVQAHITQSKFLKLVLMELETLRVSRDRLGRKEFVEAFGGKPNIGEQSPFQKLGNVFKDKV